MENISLSPAATMTAFHRGNEEEDIVMVVNMDDVSTDALLDLHAIIKGTGVFVLTDLITGERFGFNNADLTRIAIPMNGYSTRILSLMTTKRDGVVLAKEGRQ